MYKQLATHHVQGVREQLAGHFLERPVLARERLQWIEKNTIFPEHPLCKLVSLASK